MKKLLRLLLSKQVLIASVSAIALMLLFSPTSRADIYAPEGLNMPGAWNSWTNPPSNLALASQFQVTGGRVTKITSTMPHWQTILKVAASGGDLTAGTYEWLFTSGQSSTPWQNKWGGITVAMNNLQNYTLGGGNNSITITNGNWYTMNWYDNGYANTQAIYMVTSAQPVNINSVTVPLIAVASSPVTVTAVLSGSKCSEEIIYLRYSTDNWVTSSLVTMSVSGSNASAVIPGQPSGTTVKCYVFSSTVSSVSNNYDLYSIHMNTNGGAYYSYPVGVAPISWANLQTPATASLNPGSAVDVFGRCYIAGSTGQVTAAPGVHAWIGYSTTNTNPNTWTNWVSGTYVGAAGTNDEYKAAIGTGLTPGTYYYASRFQLNSDAYVYGGYNGGIWDGTTNISGILTVNGAAPAVSTGSVSSVTSTTAQVAGTVIGDGGATVTARGICWGTDQNPTTANSITTNGTGIGTFTGTLSPLVPGTTYYARAYATNIYGTSYGDEVSFSTLFTVTFNLDMSTAGTFVPGTDSVYVSGSFPNASWNMPGTNQSLKFTRIGTSLNYTLTLYLPAGTYDFKHFRNAGWSNGEWAGGTDRTVAVAGSMTVNCTWGGEINWANLQSPASGVILPSSTFEVYAKATIPNGITGVTGGATGLQCWIGFSTSNTDPSTWTNWVSAGYSGAAGTSDEFKGDIGLGMAATGTYYYASRFQYGNGTYKYGGYNGGYWDGTTNTSGVLSVVNGFVLTVTTDGIASLGGTSAGINGNVLADGGNTVTSRGVCWSTNPNPTTLDNVVESGTGLGTFTAVLNTLVPGTTYYAKAFASNSAGTVYGSEIEFTTYYNVVFNVDMSTANGFIPGADYVYIAGNFPGASWMEPGSNPSLLMTPSSGYNFTLNYYLPAGTYDFKHFKNTGWGGGEWTGNGNRSVTVSSNMVINSTWGGEISWANLQWPDAGSITSGGSYDVYAQVYIPNGVTGGTAATYGMQVWIGYSTDNTNPDTWTNWIPAPYSAASGSNDEYKLDLGSLITTAGTYYYASRFQFGNGAFKYGGFNGGFWDGTTNISGVLTVTEASKTLNLKVLLSGLMASRDGIYPPAGTMYEAIDGNTGLPQYGAGVADAVTVQLFDETPAFVTQFTDVQVVQNGTASITIPAEYSGNYYIRIVSRAYIPVWSAAPVSFTGSVINYDFTDNWTKAYQFEGNDLEPELQVGAGIYALYLGDQDHNTYIDIDDMSLLLNDVVIGSVGYLESDIDGYGWVDIDDMALLKVNVVIGQYEQSPALGKKSLNSLK